LEWVADPKEHTSRLLPEVPIVSELAAEYGKAGHEVREDLKRLAAEEHPEVTVAEFKPGFNSTSDDERTSAREEWATLQTRTDSELGHPIHQSLHRKPHDPGRHKYVNMVVVLNHRVAFYGFSRLGGIPPDASTWAGFESRVCHRVRRI